MRRVMAFLGGILSGGAIGTAVALLFAPRSGDAMRQGLRQRIASARAAGDEAAAQRRRELEARLRNLTGAPPPDQP